MSMLIMVMMWMVGEEFKNVEKAVSDLKKAVSDLKKANDKFNKSLAKVILSIPRPITYDFWCYLHKIADGDVE